MYKFPNPDFFALQRVHRLRRGPDKEPLLVQNEVQLQPRVVISDIYQQIYMTVGYMHPWSLRI